MHLLLMIISVLFYQANTFKFESHELSQAQCPTLSVATFSFENFGPDKCQNKDVLASIVTILHRYDIVLLIGLMDSDNSVKNVTNTLLLQLNSTLESGEGYTQRISHRLGEVNPQQYSFFYKPSKVKLLNFYQFPIFKGNFERSPFSALFLPANCSDCTSFWLQAINTNPMNTFFEMQDLYFITFRSSFLSFGTSNGIILGNMNADCGFLSNEAFRNLSFSTDDSFSFGLQKGVNSTTVYHNGKCAYDNFVMYKTIKPEISGVQVFNFSSALGINLKDSLAISEHYPIEMKINACQTKRHHSKQKIRV